MSARRGWGEGTINWSETEKRYIGYISDGVDARGKRRRIKRVGRTKAEVRDKLAKAKQERASGKKPAARYTLGQAVDDFVAHGLPRLSERTVENYTGLLAHAKRDLGERDLGDLLPEDVERWLEAMAPEYSPRTMRLLHSLLSRVLARAQRRGRVALNVSKLCETPEGGAPGRVSKAFTKDMAAAVLQAAEVDPRANAHISLSLLTGVRTEEIRALTWVDVDLGKKRPAIYVLRSDRAGGDTKTKRSRRGLAMPERARLAMLAYRNGLPVEPGPDDVVFPNKKGEVCDRFKIQREFRAVVTAAGLPAKDWTPREMRHSFVSLLSQAGVRIEDISRLVGHRSTSVTETVYRKQIVPVIEGGTETMNALFPMAEPRRKKPKKKGNGNSNGNPATKRGE